MIYQINDIVNKMGQIAIEGNIIPNEWYTHLKNEKGKIQTNAALLLADIVYWYRPVPIYDIKTGELTGHGKKFKDDLLQLNYKYFNHKFGLSELQIRNALVFLEKKGLIFREFRNIIIDNYVLNNVMYIGIYPEKISEINGQSHQILPTNKTNIDDKPFLAIVEMKGQQEASPLPIPQPKAKDWSAKFTDEQKAFLDYLLNIKPEVGEPIEKNHATWWIKSYGIENIKIALQVYWQRVEKAKQDSTVPMPQHIGKYVRKALNDGLIPIQLSNPVQKSEHQEEEPSSHCSQKPNQVGTEIEPGPQKNETTNTHISMTSLSVDEVNDCASVTFQKKKEENEKEQPAKTKPNKFNRKQLSSPNFSNHQKRQYNKSTQEHDWKESFTSEERKFLASLLNIIPQIGEKIEEKHATWWIKHFGIDKIKIALKVYWQQVDKAKKDSQVPMPESIGAYVRSALNKGTQPCMESHFRNKSFAEMFKKQVGWSELIITEKYCRAEELRKEWHYNLPEKLFEECLRSTFENYCSYSERQYSVA